MWSGILNLVRIRQYSAPRKEERIDNGINRYDDLTSLWIYLNLASPSSPISRAEMSSLDLTDESEWGIDSGQEENPAVLQLLFYR